MGLARGGGLLSASASDDGRRRGRRLFAAAEPTPVQQLSRQQRRQAQRQAAALQRGQAAAPLPVQQGLRLTLGQVQHAALCAALHRTTGMWVRQSVCDDPLAQRGQLALLSAGMRLGQRISPAQMRCLAGAAATYRSAVLLLEPANPRSHLFAGNAASMQDEVQQAVEHYVCAAELARQQGSDVMAVWASTFAIGLSGDCAGAVRCETLDAALAALQHAPPALARCKDLLPLTWVQEMEASLRNARRVAPLLKAPAEAAAELRAAHGALLADNDKLMARRLCDGCGQIAVGLRRCARCKAPATAGKQR